MDEPSKDMRRAMATPEGRTRVADAARDWMRDHPHDPFPISPALLLALCDHADAQAKVVAAANLAVDWYTGCVDYSRAYDDLVDALRAFDQWRS